jgi:cytochrome c
MKPSSVLSCAPLLLLALTMLPVVRGAGEETDRGKQLFEKRCKSCHAPDHNKKGPRLAGICGRQAGTEPGFKYSKALKAAGFVWDEAQLDRWLADPDSVVRHNNMDYSVPSAAERAEIIRYLKVISSPQKTE